MVNPANVPSCEGWINRIKAAAKGLVSRLSPETGCHDRVAALGKGTDRQATDLTLHAKEMAWEWDGTAVSYVQNRM